MMLVALVILFTPVCATITGLIVWAAYRHESLEDGALLRHFLIVLVIITGLGWAAGRTEAARIRLDPQYRMMQQIEADPVYSSVKQHDRDTVRPLGELLAAEMSHGATVSQAMLQARPMLTAAVIERLGFADQQTRVMWGRLVADSLKELRAADPALCYAAMGGQTMNRQTLARSFSPANSAEFEQAVVKVYESADHGMRREYNPDDKRVDFNDAALEFHAIQAEIEQEFGATVASRVAAKKYPAQPDAPARDLCAARIYQLQAMLKRPKGMAAMLIDSILR